MEKLLHRIWNIDPITRLELLSCVLKIPFEQIRVSESSLASSSLRKDERT